MQYVLIVILALVIAIGILVRRHNVLHNAKKSDLPEIDPKTAHTDEKQTQTGTKRTSAKKAETK